MTRFLLRDGNKITADISSDDFEVFSYLDKGGNEIHALSTVAAERKLLALAPRKLLPLNVRMEKTPASC